MNKTAAVLVAIIGLSIAACGSAPSDTTTAVQTIAPPLTVNQIATLVHATDAEDCGAAPLGGVTDSGIAWMGSVRIGIDVFPSPDIRDGWKTMAAKSGVAPLYQGSTWVAYKSVDQGSKVC